MKDFIDFLKLPPNILGALSIASGALLLLPDQLAKRLYMTEFRDKYGIEEIRHGSDKDKLEAYGYVENFVKNKLKSPSSAVFPSYREQIEHTDYLGEDVFKIKSWVDSQNGFGAMIRTRFVCTIYYQDNKVKCQDLQFLE